MMILLMFPMMTNGNRNDANENDDNRTDCDGDNDASGFRMLS